MLSSSGGDPGHMWGIWLFQKNFWWKSLQWGLKIWSNQTKYPPRSNAWFSYEKQVDIINNPHNPHEVRCSINLNWKWVVIEVVFLYKYKNKYFY